MELKVSKLTMNNLDMEISEEIWDLLENAAKLTTKKGVYLDKDALDGGVETVCV
jgi:hypothetical protein